MHLTYERPKLWLTTLFIALIFTALLSPVYAEEYVVPLQELNGNTSEITVDDGDGNLPRLKACVEEVNRLLCVDVNGDGIVVPFLTIDPYAET